VDRFFVKRDSKGELMKNNSLIKDFLRGCGVDDGLVASGEESKKMQFICC